jgi:hypothetical protein
MPALVALTALLLTSPAQTRAEFVAYQPVLFSAQVVYPSDGQFVFGGQFVLSSPITPTVGLTPTAPVQLPQNVGDSTNASLNATLKGDETINGGPVTPFQLSGSATVTITRDSGTAGSPLGTYDTQLTLDLTGTVAGHSEEFKTDPSNPSTGQATISDAGGGLFRINSFFDVFTDLSLDHGPFVPASKSDRLTGQVTPEPTSLVLLGLGALGLGGYAWRQRRRAASA